MVVAILLGAFAGVMGFLPLFFALRLTRKLTSTSNFTNMSALFLGVGLSFIVVAVTAILCIVLARSFVLPFVLAEAICLCVSAVGYGIYKNFRK